MDTRKELTRVQDVQESSGGRGRRCGFSRVSFSVVSSIACQDVTSCCPPRPSTDLMCQVSRGHAHHGRMLSRERHTSPVVSVPLSRDISWSFPELVCNLDGIVAGKRIPLSALLCFHVSIGDSICLLRMTRALRLGHGLFPLQAHAFFVLPVYCRARSKVSHASGAAGSTVSSGDDSGGSGSSLSSLQSERASNIAGIVSKEPRTQSVAGQDANDLRHEKQQESSGNFDHVSKGSMLLKRMGWTEGKGLGRRSDGKLQPVQVRKRCTYGRVARTLNLWDVVCLPWSDKR